MNAKICLSICVCGIPKPILEELFWKKMKPKYKIDETDERILDELRENSRVSYRELARSLGIPHTTVWTRVGKLRKRGIIKKFTVEIDEEKIKEAMLYRKSKKELIEMVLSQKRLNNQGV